jgi:DNA-binding NtrC family response regulator
MTLKQRMNDYERALILAALQATGGNQRRAAAVLGILPSTLSEKLKRLGLRRVPDVALPTGLPVEGEAAL